jgi:hypothetical protein
MGGRRKSRCSQIGGLLADWDEARVRARGNQGRTNEQTSRPAAKDIAARQTCKILTVFPVSVYLNIPVPYI